MKVGIAQCDVIPSANKKLTERDVFANEYNRRNFTLYLICFRHLKDSY